MSNEKSVSGSERGLCEIGVRLTQWGDSESELTGDSSLSADTNREQRETHTPQQQISD